MRAQHVAVSILLFLALTQPLAAQSVPLLERGTRVRVVIPSDSGRPEQALAGNLVRLSGDTVVIASGLRQPETFTLTPGRRLEVRTGSHGHAAQGAAWGFFFGGIGGAIIAAVTYEPCEPPPGWPGGLAAAFGCFSASEFSQGQAAAVGFVAGGLVGAALGAVIGATTRHEAWTPAATTGVRVGLLLSPRGAGLSVQSAF